MAHTAPGRSRTRRTQALRAVVTPHPPDRAGATYALANIAGLHRELS